MPFMGLVGYYKRFIEVFSKIAHPITSLKNKGVKFEWTLQCEESFRLLNELLTSASIFNIFFIEIKILWYVQMFAKRDLELLLITGMRFVMNLESLKSMRRITSHMT
jgi:hypothetical protein